LQCGANLLDLFWAGLLFNPCVYLAGEPADVPLKRTAACSETKLPFETVVCIVQAWGDSGVSRNPTDIPALVSKLQPITA
jgi:hypothetical protein